MMFLSAVTDAPMERQYAGGSSTFIEGGRAAPLPLLNDKNVSTLETNIRHVLLTPSIVTNAPTIGQTQIIGTTSQIKDLPVTTFDLAKIGIPAFIMIAFKLYDINSRNKVRS